jgi:hypothetical protein
MDVLDMNDGRLLLPEVQPTPVLGSRAAPVAIAEVPAGVASPGQCSLFDQIQAYFAWFQDQLRRACDADAADEPGQPSAQLTVVQLVEISQALLSARSAAVVYASEGGSRDRKCDQRLVWYAPQTCPTLDEIIEGAFRILDRDGDGVISAEDFRPQVAEGSGKADSRIACPIPQFPDQQTAAQAAAHVSDHSYLFDKTVR